MSPTLHRHVFYINKPLEPSPWQLVFCILYGRMELGIIILFGGGSSMKKLLASLALVVSIAAAGILGAGATPFTSDAAASVEAYSNSASVQINNNKPEFTSKEITKNSFETYSALDSLGRCGTATACVGKDIMPTEPRGNIGMVKPTGWNQNKYPGLVDSNPPYLYNRCHLIGYQLTGENANERNLVTGTRYMNVDGMLPYENKVADYVKSTGNHVMYRVTPDFTDNNLLCNGVKIEAYSVEDSGKGISFNVYCYNVQPGVDINYKDGSNKLADSTADDKLSKTQDTIKTAPTTQPAQSQSPASSYIANKNTKKFHYPSCSSVDDMKEKNKLYFDGSRDELISQGYVPCKRCNP